MNKPKYETILTLTQEVEKGPVSFSMEWSPPLQEFAGNKKAEPLTHTIMQHVFFKVLLPMTAAEDDEPVTVEVSTTLN